MFFTGKWKISQNGKH